MNSNLKDPLFLRQIIIEHYSNPTHKGLEKNNNNLYFHQTSESCIDDIHLELEIKDHKIIAAKFDGIGCAISTASTDIIANEISGKLIKEGLAIIANYLAMIFEQNYDETILNELIAFINVSKQPNRIKCATIGVKGYEILLKEEDIKENV